MLVKLWGNRNTHPLLVEVQTFTVTIEISVVVPEEAGNRFNSRPSYTSHAAVPKGFYILLQSHLLNHTSCGQFITARNWKQLRYLSIDEWIKKIRYSYRMKYYSDIKNHKTPR